MSLFLELVLFQLKEGFLFLFAEEFVLYFLDAVFV